ncbi:hypothetical protein [Hansschlegelia plantiphila]|uniref:Uncharacterized protein n=1 Tax=Hansschlegelia plantiphila TaxID=374655 RepID=A0A9W6J1G0_9HYPH|nr:hypothetical protein [Hansschlegelia plantiphila]GLK67628.1 hypothetical protein GCM10008179_12660 [Hansschlegelia plantiphila]
MKQGLTKLAKHVARRTFGQVTSVAIVTAAISMTSAAPAKADRCGGGSCTNVTTDYIIRVMTNVMKDMKTDCKLVRTVHLLDKSIDRDMMIYSVVCDDNEGIQQYQLTYWVRKGDVFVDKFTGSFMKSVIKRYPFEIGLEVR